MSEIPNHCRYFALDERTFDVRIYNNALALNIMDDHNLIKMRLYKEDVDKLIANLEELRKRLV